MDNQICPQENETEHEWPERAETEDNQNLFSVFYILILHHFKTIYHKKLHWFPNLVRFIFSGLLLWVARMFQQLVRPILSHAIEEIPTEQSSNALLPVSFPVVYLVGMMSNRDFSVSTWCLRDLWPRLPADIIIHSFLWMTYFNYFILKLSI